MSKKDLLGDVSGFSIGGVRKVPSIKDIKPCGSQVLVEHISQEELNDTKIHIPGNAVIADGAPQAYVVAIGPGVKTEVFGFGVGNRVLVQGNFVPVPTSGNDKRTRGLVEPTAIKAVLEE